MNTPILDELSIRTGRIVNREKIIFLLESDDLAERKVAHTGIALWMKGKDWYRSSLEYNGINVAAIAEASDNRFHICIIGEDGDYIELMTGETQEGVIKKGEGMAAINDINETFIAVGVLGKVFFKEIGSSWVNVNLPSLSVNLEAVFQYLDGGFLACGWEGGLVFIDNKRRGQLIETGTNVILTGIFCDERKVYICGQKGTVISGELDSLEVLDIGDITEDFWSIVKFKGRIYVASTTALYTLTEENSLKLVLFEGSVVPTTFYHLDTYKDEFLMSTGVKDAVLFDGEEWERIL